MSAEAYWVWDRTDTDRSNCHIWLGAKNENGREWINEVLSQANETGFYGQPRLDPELIDLLPAGDVWITTACVAGWKYRSSDEGRLLDFFQRLYEKHGDNFMFEVQYHNTPSQKELNQYILDLRSRIPAPIVMGCDSHYIRADGGQDRTDFLTSKEIYYEDEEGWYLDYPDGAEAVRRFREQGILSDEQILDAINQTNVFLNVEEYDCDIFDDSVKLFSLHPDWTQQQKDAEYERLVWKGWEQDKPIVEQSRIPEYLHEIQSEIDIVKQCGMADYFIDNYHIIRRGKELGGHLTSTGRGSAVSFYTNKLLGFTSVDRIAAKVHMYKERFMTAERILETKSLPDIDFNVAEQDIFAQGQSEVCGQDHAVQMIAYGTQKASAAWKMFAKSQGVDFQTANEVSNQIKRYEDKLKHVSEDEKEDVDILDFIDNQFHSIYKKSTEYQGIIVSWSPAPCAFLLYQGSIRKKIGLVRIKDKICCLMDGHWAEENHFLKNDLLRVAVVDLISRGYERAGIPLPSVNELLKMSPPEDPCWDIYRRGCTIGINQVEQPGTSSRVGVYAPQNISELCAFVAAIRPGFKSMYKTFESRQDFSYNVSAFDNILRTEEMPQSFCLYQEQQMAALNFAGFPMSECYAAIKNIAKKRAEKVLAYKERFIQSFCLYQEQQMAALNFAGFPMSECYAAIKNIAKKRAEKVLAYKERFITGFSDALIRKEDISESEAVDKSHMVWQILEDSARYSFNASHSYCVSLDSLYGAWLKQHYPYAFYETYMRIMEDKDQKEKLAAAKDEAIGYFGIKFPPFLFGQDNRQITADESAGTINNALSSIKGFSRNLSSALYEAAGLHTQYLTDILLFLRGRGFKRAATEPLAKISYFQPFGNDRFSLRLIDLVDRLDYAEALLFLRGRGFKRAATEPLAKISYFQPFGNDRFSLRLIDLVDRLDYAEAASYSRDLVDNSFLHDIVPRFSNGLKKDGSPATRYTITNPDIIKLKSMRADFLKQKRAAEKSGDTDSYINALENIEHCESEISAHLFSINTEILHLCEAKLKSANIEDLPFRTRIHNQFEILGSLDLVTGKPEDRKLVYIEKVRPLLDKTTGKPWGYSIFTQSLGTGKKVRLTLRASLFNRIPVKEGSIIYADRCSCNKSGFWSLNEYRVVDF